MSNVVAFKYAWVWDKVNRNIGFLNAKNIPLKSAEDIPLVLPTDMPTYNPQMITGQVPYKVKAGRNSSNYGSQGPANAQDGVRRTGTRSPGNLISHPSVTRPTANRLHPTQKPVALMEYLIRTYTNPGDTVFDNCMGSGTTGVACVKRGRSFIGIEIEERYCEIAAKRLAQEVMAFA